MSVRIAITLEWCRAPWVASRSTSSWSGDGRCSRAPSPSLSPEPSAGNLGQRIGVDLSRPEEWARPRVWLRELLTEPPYTGALTERFTDAVDQLVGSPGTLYCPARRSAGRAVPPKRAVAGKEYPAPDLHDPAVRPQAR